jgi:hypothetical protein
MIRSAQTHDCLLKPHLRQEVICGIGPAVFTEDNGDVPMMHFIERIEPYTATMEASKDLLVPGKLCGKGDARSDSGLPLRNLANFIRITPTAFFRKDNLALHEVSPHLQNKMSPVSNRTHDVQIRGISHSLKIELTIVPSFRLSFDLIGTAWPNCPACGAAMRVVERLSAAQLLLRSPPQPNRCAA